MLTLYDFLESGNGYKVRLVLHQLGRPFRLVLKNILRGETRAPDFLAKNPNGRIPLLELPDGRCLAESNAILTYLAEGTPLMPTDAWDRALVMQWLFFEQYSHEPNIATVRFWVHFMKPEQIDERQLAKKRELGYAALGVMEKHLTTRSFVVGERYSIADVALYAYTHVAHEGGFDLASYPKVRSWLARVVEQPRHVPIMKSDYGT
jgi:glutathione S-transferase